MRPCVQVDENNKPEDAGPNPLAGEYTVSRSRRAGSRAALPNATDRSGRATLLTCQSVAGLMSCV